jgi:hypothetical protein
MTLAEGVRLTEQGPRDLRVLVEVWVMVVSASRTLGEGLAWDKGYK